MDEEHNYSFMLQQAINFSKELNVPNLEWGNSLAEYHDISEINKLVNGELFDVIDQMFSTHPYIGNMCLPLSSVVYMFMKAKGYNVEMVFGNVNINNSSEFDTTNESLKREYLNRSKTGELDVHAWVGLGDNIIIDFGLPERLQKNYNYPRNLLYCVGTAKFFENSLKVAYQPMLIGTDFFKQTHSYDPLDDIFGFKKAFAN